MKRFWKYLLNLYIWSAFYAFQGLIISIITKKTILEELWINSLERFMWGHYHMWFMFLVLGFYLLLPIANQIIANKKL